MFELLQVLAPINAPLGNITDYFDQVCKQIIWLGWKANNFYHAGIKNYEARKKEKRGYTLELESLKV